MKLLIFSKCHRGEVAPGSRLLRAQLRAAAGTLLTLGISFVLGAPVDAATGISVPVDVLVFKGSLWTQALVSQRFQRAQKVIEHCGVRIELASLTSINPPTGEVNLYRELEVAGPGGLRAAAVALGRTSRLTLIFIRQFQQGQAGTAGIPRFYENMLPEMVNKAWITEEVLEPGYISARHPSYSPEAHELGHLLLNDDHVLYPNLMANEPSLVNSQLTSLQCERMKLQVRVN